MEETARGARNRAENAMATFEGAAQLGIGLESGLFITDNKMYDVCACAIFDGEHHHVGYSCAWEVPPGVRAHVEQGMNLTDAFIAEKLCDDPKIGDKGGVLNLVTGGRVTRTDYTIQSVQMALITLNPALFACTESVPRGVNDC